MTSTGIGDADPAREGLAGYDVVAAAPGYSRLIAGFALTAVVLVFGVAATVKLRPAQAVDVGFAITLRRGAHTRERHRCGPGQTDPGDALSIASRRADRPPRGLAQESEIVRALATLELMCRRFVRDRTQAIQRLRADWTQHDPVSEAATVRCDRQRELRQLKRIDLGDSLAQQIAARCIRARARDIEDLNRRIATLDTEIAELLVDYCNPLEDVHGAGSNLAATIIAQASPPPTLLPAERHHLQRDRSGRLVVARPAAGLF